MMKKCKLFTLLFSLLFSIVASAESTEGITSVTVLSSGNTGVVRVNFNYTTIDKDFETPVLLSAAMFIKGSYYDKSADALGMMLLNHFTITNEAECPSEVDWATSLEYVFAQNTSFIVVESDNIGFGETIDRPQTYLYGELTAKQNIDAMLAAKQILLEDGYKIGDKVVNLGYSQGGHSGAWVDRMVASGYRSDELPKIDYTIIGGGPYDIYGIYDKLRTENYTQYPVALPLIIYSYINDDMGIESSDVFVPELIEKIPEWLDCKQIPSEDINDSIYTLLGVSENGIEMNRVVTENVMNPESEVMAKLIPQFKKNSLVYDNWSPSKTDSILFVHSMNDEVVPYLCLENMTAFLTEQGYTNYKVDNYSPYDHTTTGTYYCLLAVNALAAFESVTTGIKDNVSVSGLTPVADGYVDVYGINGQVVRKGVKYENALESLPKGIYIINGKKYIIAK
ncbi:MAG: hypothetical protein Q4D41_11530 [Prevotellaceae bacterium]|nr:hypothetical protein [Prevotellaceae bacterium]